MAAGLEILDRDVPFTVVQMHVLPLRQHQLGLAHQGHQDQLESDLELMAEVGGLQGAQKLPDFVRRQRPVAGCGAVDVSHRQGHDRIGLDQAASQRDDDVRSVPGLERLECGVCERHGPSFGSMKVNQSGHSVNLDPYMTRTAMA